MNINKSLLMAKQHYKNNNLYEAKKLYSEILEKFPASKVAKKELKKISTKINQSSNLNIPPELKNNLIDLYSAGQLKETIDESIRLSKIYPNDAFVYNIMGISLMNIAENEEAIESYRKAIKIKSDYTDAYYNMGNALLNIGKNEEAIVSFKEAIKIKPNYADAYYNIGSILTHIGKNEEAIGSFKEAIKIKPDYADAYYNIGISLAKIGKNEEAIVSYKEAIKIKLDYADAYYNIGIILANIGKNEEAIVSFKEAIKIKPDYADAYNHIGISLAKIGKNEEAIVSFKEAIKIKSDYADAYNNMGISLTKIGKNEEAIVSFKEAIKIKSDYADAYNNIGIILTKIGKNEEAIVSFKEAIKIKPNHTVSTTNLSKILLQSIKVEDIEQLCKFQDTYLIKIYLIIHSFINKSFTRCKSLILELKNNIEKDLDYWLSRDKDKKFIIAYLELIDILNSNILEQENRLNINIDENIIYHIGESHSLAFAHQSINLENKNYTIKPLIVFGAKAWHLGNQNQNQYKTYFENYIQSLKPGSQLMLSFGEIDCRVDEGIINYHLKTKINLNDIVYQTVKDYIEYSENIFNTLQIKRIYMGVPAPVIKVSNSLNTLRIEIVKLFNESLMKITQERQLNFVDVYKLTANSDGESNLLYMCDDFHLKPSTINELNLNFN